MDWVWALGLIVPTGMGGAVANLGWKEMTSSPFIEARARRHGPTGYQNFRFTLRVNNRRSEPLHVERYSVEQRHNSGTHLFKLDEPQQDELRHLWYAFPTEVDHRIEPYLGGTPDWPHLEIDDFIKPISSEANTLIVTIWAKHRKWWHRRDHLTVIMPIER